MPPVIWGKKGGVRDTKAQWDDTIPVLIFDNAVDGKKWECQHYEHLGLTPLQTWLLHFWHNTTDKPCLFLQPAVFDRRTNASNYTPDRAYMFKQFQKTWCGPQHTGEKWLRWKTKRVVTQKAKKAYQLFRSNSRRTRQTFPNSRPYQVGHRIVPTQRVKDRNIRKANQRQRAKDDVVRQYAGWEKKEAWNKSVQAAIRSGGISKLDDVRKILALCDEDEAPKNAKRRHRAKFRVTGGQKKATRSRFPIGRKISQLFRDFETKHTPRRMDLKNEDGSHFENGARFDTVVEVGEILRDLAKRGKFQDKSQSRAWTGHNN
jgi:hypothetical protein